MMSWYGDTTGWGWVLMTIGMVAFWGLFILGIVVLVRSHSGAPQPTSACPPPTADQLLAKRSAPAADTTVTPTSPRPTR